MCRRHDMGQAHVIPARDELAIESALREKVALLFKHSPRCGTSHRAFREVARFEETASGIPVYLLDVVSERQLARAVAERLEVRHESPQVIFLAGGRPVWHASHGTIRADLLAERIPEPDDST